MFKTDGSVHHGGVENEKQTIQILNELKIYDSVVEKRGGTTQKADAVAGLKSLSIKRKKGIRNGSFDWFNTSKYNDCLDHNFEDFLSSIKEFRALPKEVISDDEFISKVRNKFDELCNSCLDNLKNEQLKEVLYQGLVTANTQFDVVVNDVETHSLYIFPFEDHPAVDYINKGYTISLQGTGKLSRKVLFSDGINVYDCGLRIRVTSNNGINAFLGLSKANKNSQVVIKLQQDNIKQLLSSTNSQKYDY